MNKITKKKFGLKRKEFFNKKLAIQIVVSIILVAAVIVTKQIDSNYSKEIISATEEKVSENIDSVSLKESAKNVFTAIKNKIPFISKKESEFAAPVNGKIHTKYGLASNGTASYYNHGMDIISNTRTVKSISDGTVKTVGSNEKLNNYVVVQDGEKQIIYGKINEVLVKEGDKIPQGTIIGALNDEDKILHLEVWENGESINPAKLFEIKD